MGYETVELAIVAAFALFGALGGVPQLLKLAKVRPHLKIVEAAVVKAADDNYKYKIHLAVNNEVKFLHRNGDATSVTAEYYVVNKEGVQCGSLESQPVTQVLVAGAKILKDAEGYHTLLPEGNPHTIVFRVNCREGDIARKKIQYEATPIVYT